MAVRLPLKTQKSARNSLARITREFYRGEHDVDRFRAMVYAMSVILNYFKFEADVALIEKLDNIEDIENRVSQVQLR